MLLFAFQVMCKFFTDGLQLTKELQKNLSAEQKIHRDIEFMPFEETRIFGIRFLYQIMWAKAKYEFKFMLHMDDDYFLCLEKLKSELYHRPKKSLVWGSYHCSFKDIIYVSVLLLLIVTTAPSRFDRREAIRATWWKNCDGAEVSSKRPCKKIISFQLEGEFSTLSQRNTKAG